MKMPTLRVAGEDVAPLRAIPFVLVHVLPLFALFTDVRPIDWLVCVALYWVRMFGVTAGYHRYFAHRTYKMGRAMQFLMAFLAQTSSQKGALWWAAHHRRHHRCSDTAEDVHSPHHGFFWSHVGWILVRRFEETDWDRIKDLSRYPELRFLNRHWWLPPTLLGLATYLVGGVSMLLIGFFLSTVLLYHGTFLINSVMHLWGSRRYATTDTSRNNLLLALLTCGEGWHNNHHHFCASANQGFFWWEIDLSFMVLKLLSALGLVSDLRKPPAAALERNRLDRPAGDGPAFDHAPRHASLLAPMQAPPRTSMASSMAAPTLPASLADAE